ncbi:kyphoscoliosis peptidase-like isoform X2 [Montipora foliosa]|uniref:kyphoscoliosis peptidase-like isoform X2 n=1 Tax=Montipora foliosa TaxID=591990 RepID=UPI0035F1064B
MGCGSSVQARNSAVVPASNNVQSSKVSITIQENREDGETFEPFTEFPTPQLLREANRKYATRQRPLLGDSAGKLLPHPNAKPKSTVFDARRFQAVDKFAVEVQVTRYNVSLQEFTNFLTETWKDDEMAKVRVIMRWLAAQQLDEVMNIKCTDKDTTLAKLQTEANTNIFLEMCQYVGIQAERVTGYSKHANLEIGENPKSLHTWVAVVINQQWRLVDPHWCCVLSHESGGDGKSQAENRVIYTIDEDYFLTNPEEFIYSHFPRDNEAWQLLARPVTFGEFVDMAYLKPKFFELDLTLLEQKKCVLYATQGEVEIKLGTPLDSSREFRYQFWMSDGQNLGDINLERFCFMEQKGNALICKIRFPVAGKFKHVLFGRSADAEDGARSFFMLCAFIIFCEQPVDDPKALPENPRQEWGPGKDLADAGLIPITHHNAVIQAAKGLVELRFKTTKPLELKPTLHSENKTKEDLQSNVIHCKENDQVVIKVQVPEDGDYALNLFNNNGKRQKSLCCYLVSSTNNAPNNQGFSIVPDNRIDTAGNNDLEMKLISQYSKDGCDNLTFKTSKLCDVIPKLELVTEKGNVLKEDFVWTEYDDKNMEISFKINFPQSGKYVFKVYAKELDKDGDDISMAYTCAMDVTSQKPGCAPFPERCSSWSRQCKLMEPFSGVLPSESTICFVLDIPQADKVTVFGNHGGDTCLTKSRCGEWNADAKTGEGNHELELRAVVNTGGLNVYTPLLKYKVEETEELKREKDLRRQREEFAKKEEEAKQEMMRKKIEKVKQELQTATNARDANALRSIIRHAENVNFTLLLPKEVDNAQQLLNSLERIQALKEAVLKLDQKTMLELRNYSKPPELVHQVIKATLLLLGYDITLTTTVGMIQEFQNAKQST